MAVYLVAYRTFGEPARHLDLERALDAFDAWMALCEGAYVVQTNLDARAVFNVLAPTLDEPDHLYVISLRRPFTGRGPQPLNAWLEDNLP